MVSRHAKGIVTRSSWRLRALACLSVLVLSLLPVAAFGEEPSAGELAEPTGPSIVAQAPEDDQALAGEASDVMPDAVGDPDDPADMLDVQEPTAGDVTSVQGEIGSEQVTSNDVEPPTTPGDEEATGSTDGGTPPSTPAQADGELRAAAQAHPALPTGAVDVVEGRYVIETSVADDKVLDASGKSPHVGSNVSSWSTHGGDNQTWQIVKDEASSWYRILCGAGASQLALGLSPTSSSRMNVALVDPDATGDGALWAFVKNGSWLRIINRAAVDLCLEIAAKSADNGANVQLGAVDTKDRRGQAFFLLNKKVSVAGSSGASEGAYALTPLVNSKVVAEVRRSSKANGANVWVYTGNGGDHQKLYVESEGNGFYTLWVVGTGKVLSQASASIVPGNNVVQRAYGSSATQRWSIRKNDDGTLTFINKATGLALGVTGSSTCANLIGTRNDGYKTTKFRLSVRELLRAGIVEIHPRTSSKVSLDVRRAAKSGKADLLLYTDSNGLNQRFELVSVNGANLWRIRTGSSGGWIVGNSSEVYQDGRGSSAAWSGNTWRVTFKGGGYSFVNCRTGLAIDMRHGKTSAGTKIIAYAANGKDSQHYAIEYTTLIGGGCYFLRNGKGNYLDISGDSSGVAAAQANKKDGSVGQYYTIEVGGTSLRIKNTYSKRYLVVKGGKVVQDTRTAKSAQLWVAKIEDGGCVSFAASGDKRLDASSSSALKVAKASHAAAQKWQPAKTTYKPFSGYVQRAVNKANASNSRTSYLLVVDKSAHRVIAMVGGNGYWRPVRDMPCSVGASGTPTVEGSFTVGDRGGSFGSGYTCWYWTQIWSGYLFHSVLYNPGSQTSLQDGRLGMNISHGCVRMRIGDAHWIYSTVPSGTKILIYR